MMMCKWADMQMGKTPIYWCMLILVKTACYVGYLSITVQNVASK